VINDARDHSIAWQWTPDQGYIDQFRRDRTVVLDGAAHSFDCGYSSWTQMPDGRIVIVDYTDARQSPAAPAGERRWISVRSYVVREEDLTGENENDGSD